MINCEHKTAIMLLHLLTADYKFSRFELFYSKNVRFVIHYTAALSILKELATSYDQFYGALSAAVVA